MEIVRCLLSFRANPNIQTNDGRSPLHVACCFGFPEVVQYLLDHNADPGIRGVPSCLSSLRSLMWMLQIMGVKLPVKSQKNQSGQVHWRLRKCCFARVS
ncbi:hypothetical protein FA13DRAFT_377595 [Coprinellus micaceus]|uniref:Uncharacterized protein n=1 Tax=Coprinellus micaceus TaxID=71717 RepID=A0A4Y7SCP3_COPMI|nr:hypothetical protein FA13DRAFT_377595 [Coprinellus micaceus]